MFFIHDLERIITLHPSYFGPNIEKYLADQLLRDVEGTTTESYYIICVLNDYLFSPGRVIPGSGYAEYTVHYKAVIWKPFKGEIVGWSEVFYGCAR